jgi:hypothetical protein
LAATIRWLLREAGGARTTADRKFKRGFGTTVREVAGWTVPMSATTADMLAQTVADLCAKTVDAWCSQLKSSFVLPLTVSAARI